MITNLQRIKDNVTMAQLCEHLGIPLKRRGHKGSGPCPVHNGKDSNFHVKDGIGRCFSQCQKTWDTIEFLKDYKNMELAEAAELLARLGNTPVERDKEYTPEEKAVMDSRKAHQASLKVAADLAMKFYQEQTVAQATPEVLSIDTGKAAPFTISQQTATDFGIALTPNANALLQHCNQVGGIDPDMLEETGFLASNDTGRRYDFFRHRMLVPIMDHHGHVLSAAGRVVKGNKSDTKWKNGKNSDIFSKGDCLFGLFQNQKAIAQHGAHIVEGYGDVITPYDHNVRTHVAQMGTALTERQLTILKRYTNLITLVYDADKAGIKAAATNIELGLRMGFIVRIVFLPEQEEGVKHDPDTYVRQHGGVAYKKFLQENQQDGFQWLITKIIDQEKDVRSAIGIGAELLAIINDPVHHADCEEWLEAKLDNKKYVKILKDRKAAFAAREEQEASLPDYSEKEAKDIEKYLVYDRNNRIYTTNSIAEWGKPVTNFTVKPIIFVKNSSESKMLLELVNVKGVKATIMVNTDDLVDIGPIKKILLATGNFLFEEWVKPFHWSRILKRIMDDRPLAYTISTLGWNNQQQFYAWANGLSLQDGTFLKTDDYGIVNHNKLCYLLPAFGKVHTFNPAEEDDNDYEDQKPFIYAVDAEAPTVPEWVELFTEVYGDSGVVALTWYMAAIFRSVIYPKFNCFPILNPWGPPGAGKSYMCDSLMAMFGHSYLPFNLTAGTDVGFFRMMAQKTDAVVSYDEYKNAISFTRVQALKAAYDGTGRVKGKRTADNRTTTTKVRSAIIMAGQEQPTQDPALMSRCISLAFTKADYTDEEKARGKRLKKIEGTAAMSRITAKLLTYREQINTRFVELYSGIETELNAMIPASTDTGVAPRMVQNNAMVLTTFRILKEAIPEIKLTVERVKKILSEVMIQQMASISQEDDLAKWWDLYEYHYRLSMIRDYKDMEVKIEEELMVHKHPASNQQHTYDFAGGTKKVLYMVMNTAYRLFAERVKREDGIKAMGKDAIRHYLRGHASYLGDKKKKIDNRAQWVMCFDMERLPFDLQLSIERKQDRLPGEEDAPPLTQKEAAAAATSSKEFDPKGEDLPF